MSCVVCILQVSSALTRPIPQFLVIISSNIIIFCHNKGMEELTAMEDPMIKLAGTPNLAKALEKVNSANTFVGSGKL